MKNFSVGLFVGMTIVLAINLLVSGSFFNEASDSQTQVIVKGSSFEIPESANDSTVGVSSDLAKRFGWNTYQYGYNQGLVNCFENLEKRNGRCTDKNGYVEEVLKRSRKEQKQYKEKYLCGE